MHSLPIKEWIGLNSKVYSIIHKNKSKEWENKKTLKGISKTTVKNEINHNDYIKKFGLNSHQALGWRKKNEQLLRFKMLIGLNKLNDCSVLDIGCGTGDLLEYFSLIPANFSSILYL
jgi:2-polyprenyl-3-methyl-5-hydroxy-6-metoxy-1,4-benzoquinol methylase